MIADQLKKIGVIRKESVTLKNAGDSQIYIDIKKAYGYPKILNSLCRLIKKHIPSNVKCIAANGYGGLPLAGALSSKYGLNLILVRDEPKSHGRNVFIDGYMPEKNEKVWIIDDVFTTGGSIKQVAKILKKTGAKIEGCSVVVKRTTKKIPLKCRYLLDMNDLI